MPVRDDSNAEEEPSLAITMLDVWYVYFVLDRVYASWLPQDVIQLSRP